MGVFFKPFPKVGGDRPGLASVAGVCALENRDVVSHETLCPRIPLGIRNPGPVVRGDVEVVVLGSAWRRQVGVAHPAVAADGHGVRPRKPLLRCGPRHPAEAASQLVGQCLAALCRPTANCPAADERLSVAPLPASAIARLSISAASMSPAAISSSGRTRRISGSSPGQLDAIQPSATPASTSVSARSSRADSSFSRYSDNPLLRRRTLKCDTACQGSAGPIAVQRWVGNVDEVERRAQAEAAPVAGDQAHALATLPAQARPPSGRNCARSPSRAHQRAQPLRVRTCRGWRTSSTRTR